MRIKQGTPRQQMQFSSLDDLIDTDKRVRIIDAFVDKLDLSVQWCERRASSPTSGEAAYSIMRCTSLLFSVDKEISNKLIVGLA